jgi:MFS family permease
LGPSLSPIAGGIAARYASWRVLQLALGICGAALFVAILLLLPETSWPSARGIDKLRKAGEPVDTRHNWLQNPFKHISIFRSPNVVAAVSSIFKYPYILKAPWDFFSHPLGYRRRSLYPFLVCGGSFRLERQLQ